eukprot:gene18333-26288_t
MAELGPNDRGSVGTNDQMLRDYFEGFGEIEEVSVKRNPDGSSRGFGFVIFRAS